MEIDEPKARITAFIKILENWQKSTNNRVKVIAKLTTCERRGENFV